MKLTHDEIPPDATCVRWQYEERIGDGPANTVDVVGFVWEGDLCWGDYAGYTETPWSQFVADIGDGIYENARIATGWEPLEIEIA